jgi:hypothetical protein
VHTGGVQGTTDNGLCSSRLGHGALKRRQLLLWEGRRVPQVRADENLYVSRRAHASCDSSLAQKDPIVRFEPDGEPDISTHLLERIRLGETLNRGPAKHGLEELPDKCRLRDLLTLRKRTQKGLHLRSHATLHECLSAHEQ